MEKVKMPIGEEFVKSKILTKKDVQIVLNYQEDHPDMKFGEIVDVLDMCEKEDLLKVLASNLEVKSAVIDRILSINPINFLPSDIIITCRALPFEKSGNCIHVAFASPQDTEAVEEVRSILKAEGYDMEIYISLYTTILAHIEKIKNSKEVRMVFSDTNSDPEITEEEMSNNILKDLKKKLRRK